ncbi:MAG: transposase [Gammaproteobacteria bacterium]|nr:transposase [Gammaproteobacteria bacterium]
MSKRRSFEPKFKEQTVALALNSRLSQTQISEELGISQGLLSRWAIEHYARCEQGLGADWKISLDPWSGTYGRYRPSAIVAFDPSVETARFPLKFRSGASGRYRTGFQPICTSCRDSVLATTLNFDTQNKRRRYKPEFQTSGVG